MKRIPFIFLFLLLISNSLFSQVTTNPSMPLVSQPVKIIFDATQGTAGLKDFTGDVYAHTGVITDKSTSGSDWKYVVADWNTNLPKARMTRVSANLYELMITPDVREFYGVPAGEKIKQMAYVFRSADRTKEGKATGAKDIFVNVYEEGLTVELQTPAENSVLTGGQQLTINAASSADATLKLFINNNLLSQATGKNISAPYTVNVTGDNWIIAEATLEGITKRDSVFVTVRSESVQAYMPATWRKGINYTSDTSAGLVLWARDKQFVYVLGDFNNWQPRSTYQMKKDGDYFWLEITGLTRGKEYIFQYYVDGSLKIADPYTEKTSDPWNDKYITSSTYENLIPYPAGKTEGIASVLQTGQAPYPWEINNFTTPAKGRLSIYELLVRDFMSEHTFKAVREKLSYLKDLRINVLELMPVNEFEGNSSWGYNPSFYFAPDKYYGPKNELKKLVDECHKQGIAVVIDMVLNHSYGQSPFVQLYWDNVSNRPATGNPWYNPQSNFQNPSAQWGYDFNHDSPYTRELVDSINGFWIKEYKIDGFRFDFTKGFSNTPYGTTSWGSNYDAARIANLKRMASEIRKRKNDALIIFEHLSDNPEEKELADAGILLWGNMNYNYGQAAIGNNDGGQSSLNWGVYDNRTWSQPNLVTYMESHDEERLVYKCLQSGKSDGGYSTAQLNTALDRMKLNSVFFLPLPGPKMIWQFGERGYDVSIETNGRLGEKPPHWEYLNDKNRTDLFRVMAELNYLKQTYDEFTPTALIYDLSGEIKWYRMQNGTNYVMAIGNFGTRQKTATLTFPVTGTWNEYFTKGILQISDLQQPISLNPGEYRLYSLRVFNDPEITTRITDLKTVGSCFTIYPNPANEMVTIRSGDPFQQVEVLSLSGKRLFLSGEESQNIKNISLAHLPRGIYLLRINQSGHLLTQKLIVN